MSTYDLTSSIPSSSVLKTGDILNCPYSGSSKTSTSSSPSDDSNYGGFGFGGYGSYYRSGYGGAGGGGWYGGCGTYPDRSGDDNKGGGGGSGYVYTSGTASNYPSGCTLNSAYYLTDTSLVNGGASFTDYDGSTVTGHSGNGAVRITCLEVNNVAPPTNLKATVNGGNVTLTWNASTTSGISGYDVTLIREGTTIRTVRVTSTSYKSAFVAGKWTVQVKTVKGEIHSAAVSTTFTVVAPDPPSDLTYTLDRGVVTLN